ncbi:MAG: septal ring lytic transglycosylase RlpA family protein [Alphaproteobacteria bacterium]|nr:septal ring lytic transglycosylase RlpA family protein [Alphaproteobacteria bacterium]
MPDHGADDVGTRAWGKGRIAGRAAILAILLMGLTGCAEMQFLSEASKEVNGTRSLPPNDPNTPDIGGRYKIGNPYQVAGIWYYPKEDFSYAEEGIASWYGPGFDGKRTANGAVFYENKVSAAHRTLPIPSMVRVTNLENGRSIKVIVNDRGPFAHSRIIDLSRRAAQLLGYERKGTTLVRVEMLEQESRQLMAMVNGDGAIASNVPVPKVSTAPEPPMPAASPTAVVSGEDLAPPPGVAASQSTQVASASGALPEPEERPAIVEKSLDSGTVEQMPVEPNPHVFIQAGAFGQYDNANRARSMLGYLGPVIVEEITRSETPLFRVRIGPLADDDRLESLLVAVIQAGYTDAAIVVPKK